MYSCWTNVSLWWKLVYVVLCSQSRKFLNLEHSWKNDIDLVFLLTLNSWINILQSNSLYNITKPFINEHSWLIVQLYIKLKCVWIKQIKFNLAASFCGSPRQIPNSECSKLLLSTIRFNSAALVSYKMASKSCQVKQTYSSESTVVVLSSCSLDALCSQIHAESTLQ